MVPARRGWLERQITAAVPVDNRNVFCPCYVSNMAATGSMWLLCTRNVALVAEEGTHVT